MLHKELESRLSKKTVVVGVGDAAHGDDGVGPLVVQLLMEVGFERVVDAGVSPEIETWRIRQMSPDFVLFVDAVDLQANPGDTALLSPDDLRDNGFDTHRAPVKLTMRYLERELHCPCLMLAIQPKDVRLGAPMCEEVKQTAEDISRLLRQVLG